MAGPDTRLQRTLQMFRPIGGRTRDGPPSRLQRVHDPAVVREVFRRAVFRFVQARGPECRDLSIGCVQVAADAVEIAVQQGMPDRIGPQLARLTGLRIGMGQRAHLLRGLDRGGSVVEGGQRDRRGPH